MQQSKTSLNCVDSDSSMRSDMPRYTILKSIPHRRVVNQKDGAEEVFDLYQLGIFSTMDSIFKNLAGSEKSGHEVQEIVELVELQPQAEYFPHYHEHSAALIYIILGSGTLWLGDDTIAYDSKVRVMIPAGVLHGFKTNERTLFLSIQSPPILNPENGHIDLHYKKGS